MCGHFGPIMLHATSRGDQGACECVGTCDHFEFFVLSA